MPLMEHRQNKATAPAQTNTPPPKHTTMKKYATVLSIAGSDTIGGAGIQADIKTCCSIGTYAMTAITSLTSQNTLGVTEIFPTPPHTLATQLDAIIQDVTPDAIKIGMIPDADTANVIADFLETHLPINVVVDPVMIATSGDTLSTENAITILKNRILPLATIVTPNIPETTALTGMEIYQKGDMKAAAIKIIEDYGCENALIKGGHLQEQTLTDLLMTHARKCTTYTHPKITTINTHGTGCSLSSAIASYLAKGCKPQTAIRNALRWEYKAIAKGAKYTFGHGNGPINHIFKTI